MSRHLSPRARLALAVSLATAGFAAAAPARADVPFQTRTSVGTITYAKPDFTGAAISIANTVTLPAGASGQKDFTFYAGNNLIAAVAQGGKGVIASAGISFVDPDPDYGYAQVDGSVKIASPLGAGGSSFILTDTCATSTLPTGNAPLYRYSDGSVYKDYGFLPAFTHTNLPSIEYFLPFDGSNLVDEGGVFTVQLLIAGNFSSTAGLDSGAGQHYLFDLNPKFKIVDDFVYDPVTNQTRFTATNSNYSYDYSPTNNPLVNLDVYFFGPAAAVPEPASWATMILGMGLIGALARRRAWGTLAVA